jgi:hypothetical protein
MSAFCRGNDADGYGVSVYWPMGIESKGCHSRTLRGGTVNCVYLEPLSKARHGHVNMYFCRQHLSASHRIFVMKLSLICGVFWIPTMTGEYKK